MSEYIKELEDAIQRLTAAAYAAARTATLKICAEIVRKHYPTLPT